MILCRTNGEELHFITIILDLKYIYYDNIILFDLTITFLF